MLEQLTRPFAAPQALSTRRLVAKAVKTAPQKCGFSFGVTGTLPSPVEEPVPTLDGVSFTLETCAEDYQEASRATEKVPVRSTADPTQILWIERIKKISFTKIEQQKLVGVISSETTVFSEVDLGGAFQTVSKSGNCKSNFALNS